MYVELICLYVQETEWSLDSLIVTGWLDAHTGDVVMTPEKYINKVMKVKPSVLKDAGHTG
jgi:hypothetical protein